MNGQAAGLEDVLAGASERVLAAVHELYDAGLTPGTQGSVGLSTIAAALGVNKQVRRPRKKISVCIVGNHSAGKSSFINWYVGERICKTGVAIETRGFIICTSGRKRETLTGDATIRYFDYLEGFGEFQGLLPNLFTEVSTSKERAFSCVDFVDTPGLVDGDMKYPFNVRDTILWMAQHVDLILVFFDPMGQATCRRTMEVVEALNQTSHLEKIRYYCSKADEVADERDRARVLIQITQNLATRIRNSHAFNLPTIYLPHEEDGGLGCGVPNSIEDVCLEIDNAIKHTVQRNLTQVKADCSLLQQTILERREADAAARQLNASRTLHGALLLAAGACVLLLLALAVASRAAGAVCALGNSSSRRSGGSQFIAGDGSSGGLLPRGACRSGWLQQLSGWDSSLGDSWGVLAGGLLGLVLVLGGAARAVWRHQPTLDKRQLKRLDEYAAVVAGIRHAGESLWDDYFATLGDR